MSSTPLTHLSASGVAVWLDDLSRPLLTSGGLADLVRERSVVGVTTNPTIFAGAISGSDAYDADLRALAREGVSVDAAITRLTTDDVRAAIDVLAPVLETTGGQDGRVSIEVSPDLAHSTEETVAQAKALAATVDRDNALIKIPATLAGIPAIEECIAAGISVNVTLIFSLQRYREVIDAYLSGLRRAQAGGDEIFNKDTNKRAQCQIYLNIAEREYLRRRQRYEKSSAEANIYVLLCRDDISKA